MKQKFIDAVKDGNVISVRYSLSNEMLLDPRGDSYHEMKAYAEQRLDNLYEPLDGIIDTKPAEDYSEAELMELKNALDANFSKERLQHYEQVVAIVLRDKAEKMEQKSFNDNCGSKCGKFSSEEWTKSVATSFVTGVAAGVFSKLLGATTRDAVVIALSAGIAVAAAAKIIFKDNERKDDKI